MASFSILIGAGRILVQESLVMSLKKKKNALLTFDFSSQDGVSLYGLGCPEL